MIGNSLNRLIEVIRQRKSLLISATGISAPLIFGLQSNNVGAEKVILYIVLLFFVFAFLPKYTKIVIALEDRINLYTAKITAARLIRPLSVLPVSISILFSLSLIEATPEPFIGQILITTIASAGLYGIAFDLAYKGIGERFINTMVACTVSIWLISFVAIVQSLLGFLSILVGFHLFFLIKGIASDARSIWFPKNGVGVFFGTFNPMHRTHIKIIKKALADRKLRKIYIHSTTVPKLHRDAIKNGELAVTYQSGMRIYRKTAYADLSKNYFPTGNQFYDYETRRELIKSAIKDAGLSEVVEVLDMPDIYEKAGFSGVLAAIMKINPNTPVHGLHGSDTGGMWVRNIFDNSGWVYPYPIRRSDNVSATAIREGATGLTTESVERFLAITRSGQDYKFDSGLVCHTSSSENNLESKK